MNTFSLAWAAVKSRMLPSSLSIISIASGVALLLTIFLLSNAIQQGVARNAQGIDIVVGAKGSPIQLVLSTIYHSDIPNGNIEMKDYEKISKNPQIKKAVPIAIGDNYKGWRIVGSTTEYLDLFNAEISDGRRFAQPFEVVAGASTGLKIGDEFAAMHGFTTDSDDVHDFHLYKVVGILKPTATVLDRLLVTPFKSVQDLHSHPHHDDPDAAEEVELGHQITAILIQVKSPVAVLNLPREINKSTNMLAVSPSYQLVKLSQSLGIGKSAIMAIGYGVMVLSALTLLTSLMASLSARKYDLAVLRVLGASRSMISFTVLIEAMLLTVTGSILGLVAGHILSAAIASSVFGLNSIVIASHLLCPDIVDIKIMAIAIGVGLLASAAPAILVRKTDIATILSKGRH